jgi:hypothetical protein
MAVVAFLAVGGPSRCRVSVSPAARAQIYSNTPPMPSQSLCEGNHSRPWAFG